MSRQAKKQLPATPIEFPRADPAELAKFDPCTKICTMNCGQHTDDSRSPAECKLLCDDCLRSIPKQPVPVSADIPNDSLRDMARDSGLPVEWWQKQPSREWRELSEFARKVTERERAARQAAQVENEELKARLARAGIELRIAVRKELQACAAICQARADGWDHAAPTRDDTAGCMRHAAKNEAMAIGAAIQERIQA